MPRDQLGEFEKLVLLALLQLQGESYGAEILDEIEDRTGRTASSGATSRSRNSTERAV